MAISDEHPPANTPDRLAEYLYRQFLSARREVENSDQVNKYTAIPHKLSIGKLYYFLNAIAGDPIITAEGLYVYKSTGWQAL